MDQRTELNLINKLVREHNRDVGESITWYEYLPVGLTGGTVRDDVYDVGISGTGGRSYKPGVIIPTVYVEELEDNFRSHHEGRQPMQGLRVVVLYKDIVVAGLSSPAEYKPHLNDIIRYQDRYYKVRQYRVRGRASDDVVVGVHGFEVYIDQEFSFDPGPQDVPTELVWPSSFPSIV